jgi:transposase
MRVDPDSRPCVGTTAQGNACKCFAVEGSTYCIAHIGRVRRQPALTPEITARIANIVSSGSYLTTAIAAAGVPRQTFYGWWKRGDPDGEDPSEAGFRDMRERIERARAEGEARNVAVIAKAAQDANWQAAAWMLERSFPERWARPSQRPEDATAADSTPASTDDPFGEVDELHQRRQRRNG